MTTTTMVICAILATLGIILSVHASQVWYAGYLVRKAQKDLYNKVMGIIERARKDYADTMEFIERSEQLRKEVDELIKEKEVYNG